MIHSLIAIHIDLLRQQNEKLILRCPACLGIDFLMIFRVFIKNMNLRYWLLLDQDLSKEILYANVLLLSFAPVGV